MNNTNQGTGAGMDVLAVMDATANECGLHDNDKLRQARATVEAMADALQKLRDAHIAHRGNYPLLQSADYSAMQAADAALAAHRGEAATPAGGGAYDSDILPPARLPAWNSTATETPAGGGGELPELPEPDFSLSQFRDGQCIAHAYTATQMREYGERCRLASTGSAPAPSAWRPIATLPTDDTLILAGCADGRMMIWRADILARNLAGPTPEHLRFPAIGWQPLPAAPTQEAKP